MLTAHHTVAFLVLAVTWGAALAAGLAYLRRKEPRSIVTHLLALAQSILVAQVALGLLLLSEHKRAPARLHYLYGTLSLLAVLAPWMYAPAERRALMAFAVGLLAVSGALFVHRLHTVPDAPPPGMDVQSFFVAVRRVLNLVGPESFDGLSRALAWTWTAAPVLVVLGLMLCRRSIDARPAFVFLASAVLACTPALTFRRDDMLFFAVSFAALFYGSALWALARDHPALRAAAAVLFASGVLGGAHVSRAFALNFHPDSARAIRWNAQMLYGAYAERATIPAERRTALERQLAAHGVMSAADLPGLGSRIGRARRNGPFEPVAPGTLFFPRLPENDF